MKILFSLFLSICATNIFLFTLWGPAKDREMEAMQNQYQKPQIVEVTD